jgi:hypothetical protein
MFSAVSALAEQQVQTNTTVTQGKDGEQDGYWVEVTEAFFDWEQQAYIEVVAYYRAYRSSWIMEMTKGQWGLANTWNHSGARYEDVVEAAVKKAGWDTTLNYVQKNIPYGWQNQGIVLINLVTGELLGHLPVGNSYDALSTSFGMYDRVTDVSLLNGKDKPKVKVKLVATSVWASPIVMDLEGLGRPDLLAGPTWKLEAGRQVAMKALRAFDLDGQGLYTWEWVGPKSGLLAWDADGTGEIKSGHQLFGNYTWGSNWKDGYQALATLDKNDDGFLQPEEFTNLVVWIDANSNARWDAGESHSLTELDILSINVRPERDALGNSSCKAGFVRNVKGKPVTLQTWDWISMGHAAEAEGIYQWVGHDGERPLGGYFRLHEKAGVIGGYSLPTIGHAVRADGLMEMFPITGKRVRNNITWTLPARDGKVWSEISLDRGGTHMFGKTRAETKEISTEYLWQAQLISGQPIGQLPTARFEAEPDKVTGQKEGK